jgi:hypothetical protein
VDEGGDVTDAVSGRGAPPAPDAARSYDELAARLRALRAWSGMSYRALHRAVVRSRRDRRIVELPAFDTVHRCLQPGRTRVDVELVVDVAASLLGDREPAEIWRQACQVVARTVSEASLVTVSEVPPDQTGFTGRQAELAILLEAASRPYDTQHGFYKGFYVAPAIETSWTLTTTKIKDHNGNTQYSTQYHLNVNVTGYDVVPYTSVASIPHPNTIEAIFH